MFQRLQEWLDRRLAAKKAKAYARAMAAFDRMDIDECYHQLGKLVGSSKRSVELAFQTAATFKGTTSGQLLIDIYRPPKAK